MLSHCCFTIVFTSFSEPQGIFVKVSLYLVPAGGRTLLHNLWMALYYETEVMSFSFTANEQICKYRRLPRNYGISSTEFGNIGMYVPVHSLVQCADERVSFWRWLGPRELWVRAWCLVSHFTHYLTHLFMHVFQCRQQIDKHPAVSLKWNGFF